ncbi:MAG: response regulator [Nitrospinae bacterium]|nr:response regulator [Nitrospinota bacterium]MBL7021504.1 response regulator [Nitrospinaceae bacterium]
MNDLEEHSQKYILVVDDNEILRDGLRIDLQANGYEVLTVSDGLVALEVLHDKGRDIQLIISDEKMETMSGFELCQRVKANPEWWSIPLVFLTARTDERDFLEGFRLGASDYLSKPYCYEKLLAIVSKRINDYKVIQEYFSSELERSRLESIEQMARGVIHDMTGVLTDLGFGEVVQEHLSHIRQTLSESKNIDKDASSVLDEIESHCDELKQAINFGVNLLDGLQTLCQGHGEEKTLQMLGDIVEIPLKLLQKSFATQGIKVECDIAEALIDCRKQDIVQLVLNLIRNAAQAMQTSPIKHLKISSWEEDDQLFFSVSDTGCGIPPEQRGKIFDWGFTSKRNGKGIGMPTVKRIVEAHHGSIIFESRVKKGTTFTVAFPAYQDALNPTF